MKIFLFLAISAIAVGVVFSQSNVSDRNVYDVSSNDMMSKLVSLNEHGMLGFGSPIKTSSNTLSWSGKGKMSYYCDAKIEAVTDLATRVSVECGANNPTGGLTELYTVSQVKAAFSEFVDAHVQNRRPTIYGREIRTFDEVESDLTESGFFDQ